MKGAVFFAYLVDLEGTAGAHATPDVLARPPE